MNYKLIFSIGLFMTFINVEAQQISLYGSDGEARAYIDYNKNATVFLWDGTPVAFVISNRNELYIIGFNGSFLGWYADGIIYDRNGNAIGARKGATSMVYRVERVKGVQQVIPVRPVTPIIPVKPVFKSFWGNTPLIEFLYYGKK